MSKKTFALVLILAPLLSAGATMAQGCPDHVKMSCAEGTAWDGEKGICAPKPSA